ncbi:T9SS type A sorting domain-containing protein [Algibacter sp. L1A34]|uniref:T9SS type A sorting domain-containing protein n=1 Tax=Algibacter sp. L1A34 TaxID=2686365 RepID=UPI00131D3CAA|nr:T9SS type A sorting domain-containing protein [Algibacter sp. L1A34]
MKTLLLSLAFIFSITISAQITKTEAFTTGTKLAFYINECGNTMPEAAGKLSFCDRNNNLGVVERSYGLSDRRVLRMFPNHFNEDEYYLTGYGISIRKADGTWDNLPHIAVPLWGSTYLPTIQTGLVLPNGKIIIQGNNAGAVLNVYDRLTKTFTSVNFPDNRYPQQMVYDEDRDITWVFATKTSTTYLYMYNDANQTLKLIKNLGTIGLSTGSTTIGLGKTKLLYHNDFIYIGGFSKYTYGLYKLNVSNLGNSAPITYYDTTTTPSLPFDRINDLQIDANNDLWLANNEAYDGAIVKFNITTETYTTYQLPRPDNAAVNIKFNTLALDDNGLIWAAAYNYNGLVKLTIENDSPTWTLLPKEDLTTLGVPVTYIPDNIYYRNNKFYYTTRDYSSGINFNYEVIINDNDVWSGRNDNEEGNLSYRMNRRFTKNLSDENGGVWWFNRYDNLVLYRDSEDKLQTIDLQYLSQSAAIDDDNKAIIQGGSPSEIRKIDFPNAISIQENANQATDIKRVGNQVWIFDHANKKIDVYKDDALLTSYDLGEDWYQQAYYFAVDDNGDAWFMQYSTAGALEIKKFDTITLTSTTYDLSSVGSMSYLRKIVAAPNGGVWFLGNTAAIYQEAGVFYDFKAIDYSEIYNLLDVVVDTNGKAYLLNNDVASIATIENPTDANPIVENVVIEDYNSIMPSLDHYRPASLAIDSEGSVWTHASLNTFKLIDDDLATEYIAQPTLSISDNELVSMVEIYPNPSNAIFSIKTNYQIDTIEVFSVLGIKVKTFKNTKEINLTNQESGVYLLKISAENKTISKIIILQQN